MFVRVEFHFKNWVQYGHTHAILLSMLSAEYIIYQIVLPVETSSHHILKIVTY